MGVSQGQMREKFLFKGKKLISVLIRPLQRMTGTAIMDLASTIRISRDEA